MKLLLTILIFSTLQATCQTNRAIWVFNNPSSVSKYIVEFTTDTTKTWTVVTTILPGKPADTSVLPDVPGYYRVHAVGAEVMTHAAYVSFNVYSSTITVPVISTSWWTDKLTWTTAKESNVTSYLIERSSGNSWLQQTSITAKGNSNYSYSNSRGWFSKKPSYRVTTVYKNGTKGIPISFK